MESNRRFNLHKTWGFSGRQSVLVNSISETGKEPGYIEIVNKQADFSNFKYALFDFDGTISLLREGWQQVMAPLMVEYLKDTPEHEDGQALEQFVWDYIGKSTGIDTIYQMMFIADEVRKRGGTPRDPLEYKKEYLRRLWERIQDRVHSLEAGKIKPEDITVLGSLDFLAYLKAKGIEMYVASGTDHDSVVREANAVGAAGFFGEHIYGALDNYWERSKAKVIKDILEKNSLSGNSLVVFGDGFVEIENCKQAGGLAVGVASDEVNGFGLNEWKRERLINAGADIIISDFGNPRELYKILFPVQRSTKG